MSHSEVVRFQEYLKGHPELVPEFGKGRMSHALAIASEHGFKVTLTDLMAFVKARAAEKGRVLDDAQLDKIAGGWEPGKCMESIHCCL